MVNLQNLETYKNKMLEINLDKIVENWKSIGKKTGVKAAAVLKANAYGMGAEEISKALENAGCDTFFVIHPEEGIKLRKTIKKGKIYILGGPEKEAVKDMKALKLTPVINSKQQAMLWGKNDACAVHLFTGMRRYSMPENEWVDVKKMGLNIDLLMSHLACADEKNHPMNALQRENFIRLTEGFKGVRRALAASEFETLGSDFFFDMIRPGYYMYDSAVNLNLKIRQVQQVKKGDPVGYNNTFTFKKDGKMATVFMGYADGLPRIAQNEGLYGYIGDYKVPLVGRISMDISTFDISEVPDKIIEKEGRIELIGKHISLKEMGKNIGSIGYEVLTNLRLREGKTYTCM